MPWTVHELFTLMIRVLQMTVDQSDSDAEEDDEDEDIADDESFASLDDLEGMSFQRRDFSMQTSSSDEGVAHVHQLSKLAEKDPEFYKYLEENDKELLEFNPEDATEGENEEDVDMDSESLPVLTKDILRGWQKTLLDACFPLVGPGLH